MFRPEFFGVVPPVESNGAKLLFKVADAAVQILADCPTLQRLGAKADGHAFRNFCSAPPALPPGQLSGHHRRHAEGPHVNSSF